MGLSARSRTAIELLKRRPPGEWSPITSEATIDDGGEPWINWRTAQALERRGLVEIDWDLCRLTDAGRS